MEVKYTIKRDDLIKMNFENAKMEIVKGKSNDEIKYTSHIDLLYEIMKGETS